jgi:hypothetical protein
VSFAAQTVQVRGRSHVVSFYDVELSRMLAERAGQPRSRIGRRLPGCGLMTMSERSHCKTVLDCSDGRRLSGVRTANRSQSLEV